MTRNNLAASLLTITMLIAPLAAQAVDTKILPRTGIFYIPGDGDKIKFSKSGGKPGHITFCLSTVQKITWWKGIKVFGDNSSNTRALLATQDKDHGPSCRSISLSNLQEQNSRLEFWKAKTFGVHTDMVHYTFYPSDYNGKKLSFTWMTD